MRDGRKPSIQFTPSKPALRMIDALLASGFYGNSRSDVVRELVYRELRQLISDEMLKKLNEIAR